MKKEARAWFGLFLAYKVLKNVMHSWEKKSANEKYTDKVLLNFSIAFYDNIGRK